ncbi:MAG: homoserine kinase [Chitinophagaceae bacterium]|jgi:homoserine kinase|nr:homoserine kinase [Chitinophagaceae bacterium]MBP6045927.1 homoserine kinase [Ferruginibacter sp.]MBK8930620.1 homoserine kinase [Chitinophagaceae bacterium]MBP6988574.1 homoserine kinase [Ferruginibacter sp.]MBP7716836.1 homoserine kinase [Ferruginibacter sp.]
MQLDTNPQRTVKVSAPGTVANLVCGFDVLGLCLNHPADEMQVTITGKSVITISHTGEFPLPFDAAQNTAGAALLEIKKLLPAQTGFDIFIKKNINPGSGIGSSAASAAGAVVAANYLLGNPFTKEEMVQFALFGEKAASGVKHADNVAPCIYGGITLIRSIFPVDIIRLSSPPLWVTVVHPQIEVRTADARQILKKQVLLKDAIKQWGNIAGLVAGLLQHDYNLISRSLEDVIIEPVRSILIPEFNDIKKRSIRAGALGGGISGSGPSVFMLSKDEQTAQNVKTEMNKIYDAIGLLHQVHVTSINTQGVKIVTE